MRKAITIVSLFVLIGCKTAEKSSLSEPEDSEKKSKSEVTSQKIGTWKIGETYILKSKEKLLNKEVKTGFVFHGVLTDSRCPKGVNCFHAGNVTIEMGVLDVNGLETTKLNLIKEAAGEGPEDTYEGDGFMLKLLEVNPYPVNNQVANKDDYSIKITMMSK